MIRAYANKVWFTAIPAQLREGARFDERDTRNETDECKGCLWEKAGFHACRAATEAARQASLPDCESRPDLAKPGFIYVADPSAGRQLDMLVQA